MMKSIQYRYNQLILPRYYHENDYRFIRILLNFIRVITKLVFLLCYLSKVIRQSRTKVCSTNSVNCRVNILLRNPSDLMIDMWQRQPYAISKWKCANLVMSRSAKQNN